MVRVVHFFYCIEVCTLPFMVYRPLAILSAFVPFMVTGGCNFLEVDIKSAQYFIYYVYSTHSRTHARTRTHTHMHTQTHTHMHTGTHMHSHTLVP